MPRVTHVKKARKDNPAVKAGESYYWWKFRFGGKIYSKTYPKPSQLTQSDFLSTLYSEFEHLEKETELSIDDFEIHKETIQEMLENCEESLGNMPDSLQYSPTGELLQERIDALSDYIGELDSLDLDDTAPAEILRIVLDNRPGL